MISHLCACVFECVQTRTHRDKNKQTHEDAWSTILDCECVCEYYSKCVWNRVTERVGSQFPVCLNHSKH
jgi:hypothetical protein